MKGYKLNRLSKKNQKNLRVFNNVLTSLEETANEYEKVREEIQAEMTILKLEEEEASAKITETNKLIFNFRKLLS